MIIRGIVLAEYKILNPAKTHFSGFDDLNRIKKSVRSFRGLRQYTTL